MAEKSGKKKPKKAAKTAAGDGVLGSLPASRPARIGGERRARASAPKATAAVPKVTATKPAASKSTATKAAAPKTRTARPRVAGAERTTAATPAASAAAKQAAAARPEAAPRVPPPDDGRRPGGPPRGTEIVTTAVQAAGELAQIGLTVGGQLLKRAADRLPRP